MTDFLARESELLGDEFSTPTETGGSFATAAGDDIDFEHAISAFPDIEFDGDIPVPSAPSGAPVASSGSFSFDDFDTPSIRGRDTDVKVTGDDEIEKFENEFPELDMPSVSATCTQIYVQMTKAKCYAGVHLTATSALVRCCSSFCTTPATVYIFINTHFGSAVRRRRAASHQVCNVLISYVSILITVSFQRLEREAG